MRNGYCHTKLVFGIFLLALFCPVSLGQDKPTPPKPIAVRWWGHAMVSIETFWNLTVVIDPFSPEKLKAYKDPEISADLVLVTHEHFDHNQVELVKGTFELIKGLDADGKVLSIDKVFDRPVNTDRPVLTDYSSKQLYSENAIRIVSVASHHDNREGSERGHNAMFVIEANGVRILHCGDLGQDRLTETQLNQIGHVDVLIVPVGGVYTIDAVGARTVIEQIEPAIILPVHFGVPELGVELKPLDSFLKELPRHIKRVTVRGNTFAVSRKYRSYRKKGKVMVLQPEPWVMPADFLDMFQKKEAKGHECKKTYQDLSVKQLNHLPSNNTHCVRWNAEHITSTELNFFSKIYSRIDPMIPQVDMTPAQTPPDYVPIHPNWNGPEEARQFERVMAFVRRFAYLLDGIELSEKPAGSPWVLEKLLTRMKTHYTHHTDKVLEKFELPDWPKR